MEIREYLIRVHFCKHIGIKREHLILEYILKNKTFPDKFTMMEILNINYQIVNQIFNEIYARETTLKIKKALQIAKVVTILDDEYPEKLMQTYDPPIVLFYRGDLTLIKRPILAVVGARQNSNYSNEVLQQIIPKIIAHKIVTISGLAQGVDSLCHRLTINNGGSTIGVIGTGIDKYYPKCNHELQKNMEQHQLVLTEFLPSNPPKAFHFPMRNRIIAGLCDSLLVVEAKAKSGSLITANIALQENRNVLVIPGNITSNLSKGCNELFREGAKPIFSGEDIIEEFSYYLTK